MAKNFRGRSAKSIEAALLRDAHRTAAEDLLSAKVSLSENARGEIKMKKKTVFDLTHTYDALDETVLLQPLYEVSRELRKFAEKSSSYFEGGRYIISSHSEHRRFENEFFYNSYRCYSGLVPVRFPESFYAPNEIALRRTSKMFSKRIFQQTDEHRNRAAQRSRGRSGDQVENRGDQDQEEAPDSNHRVGNVPGRGQQEQHRAAKNDQKAIPTLDGKAERVRNSPCFSRRQNRHG